MTDSHTKILERIKPHYKTQNTFAVLEEFLEKQPLLQSTQISIQKELQEKAAQILSQAPELGRLAVALCQLKNQYLYLYYVLQTKLRYLVLSIVHAINTDNHLSLALCSRSLLEHAATLSFLVEQTGTVVEALTKSEQYPAFSKELDGLRSTYSKMFYGTRFFKNPGLMDAVSVGQLIKKHLSAEIKDVQMMYAFLCDFVHPNFGSNILVSTGHLGDGVIDPPMEAKQDLVEQILVITGILVSYLQHKVVDFSSLGILIDDSLAKTLHVSSNLADIFQTRRPEFTGDGKSKDTAVFFTNARTPFEHISMQRTLIQQLRLQVEGPRYTARIEGGFVFDVYPTTEGQFWFKVPPAWSPSE
jgi:hypothetical protein